MKSSLGISDCNGNATNVAAVASLIVELRVHAQCDRRPVAPICKTKGAVRQGYGQSYAARLKPCLPRTAAAFCAAALVCSVSGREGTRTHT